MAPLRSCRIRKTIFFLGSRRLRQRSGETRSRAVDVDAANAPRRGSFRSRCARPRIGRLVVRNRGTPGQCNRRSVRDHRLRPCSSDVHQPAIAPIHTVSNVIVLEQPAVAGGGASLFDLGRNHASWSIELANRSSATWSTVRQSPRPGVPASLRVRAEPAGSRARVVRSHGRQVPFPAHRHAARRCIDRSEVAETEASVDVRGRYHQGWCAPPVVSSTAGRDLERGLTIRPMAATVVGASYDLSAISTLMQGTHAIRS